MQQKSPVFVHASEKKYFRPFSDYTRHGAFIRQLLLSPPIAGYAAMVAELLWGRQL